MFMMSGTATGPVDTSTTRANMGTGFDLVRFDGESRKTLDFDHKNPLRVMRAMPPSMKANVIGFLKHDSYVRLSKTSEDGETLEADIRIFFNFKDEIISAYELKKAKGKKEVYVSVDPEKLMKKIGFEQGYSGYVIGTMTKEIFDVAANISKEGLTGSVLGKIKDLHEKGFFGRDTSGDKPKEFLTVTHKSVEQIASVMQEIYANMTDAGREAFKARVLGKNFHGNKGIQVGGILSALADQSFRATADDLCYADASPFVFGAMKDEELTRAEQSDNLVLKSNAAIFRSIKAKYLDGYDIAATTGGFMVAYSEMLKDTVAINCAQIGTNAFEAFDGFVNALSGPCRELKDLSFDQSITPAKFEAKLTELVNAARKEGIKEESLRPYLGLPTREKMRGAGRFVNDLLLMEREVKVGRYGDYYNIETTSDGTHRPKLIRSSGIPATAAGNLVGSVVELVQRNHIKKSGDHSVDSPEYAIAAIQMRNEYIPVLSGISVIERMAISLQQFGQMNQSGKYTYKSHDVDGNETETEVVVDIPGNLSRVAAALEDRLAQKGSFGTETALEELQQVVVAAQADPAGAVTLLRDKLVLQPTENLREIMSAAMRVNASVVYGTLAKNKIAKQHRDAVSASLVQITDAVESNKPEKIKYIPIESREKKDYTVASSLLHTMVGNVHAGISAREALAAQGRQTDAYKKKVQAKPDMNPIPFSPYVEETARYLGSQENKYHGHTTYRVPFMDPKYAGNDYVDTVEIPTNTGRSAKGLNNKPLAVIAEAAARNIAAFTAKRKADLRFSEFKSGLKQALAEERERNAKESVLDMIDGAAPQGEDHVSPSAPNSVLDMVTDGATAAAATSCDEAVPGDNYEHEGAHDHEEVGAFSTEMDDESLEAAMAFGFDANDFPLEEDVDMDAMLDGIGQETMDFDFSIANEGVAREPATARP